METAIGVVIGGVLTWLVSRWYYKQAGDELRAEAQELQRLTTLILHALHHAGVAQVNWDARGRPKGINITIAVPAGSVTVTAPPASIIQGPAPGQVTLGG